MNMLVSGVDLMVWDAAIQAAAETVRSITVFHVMEASGFVAVISSMWRFSLKILTSVSELKGNVRVLGAELKSHIKSAPSERQNVARAETDKSVDRMTEVTIQYGERIEDLSEEVKSIRIQCAKRHGQNGMT